MSWFDKYLTEPAEIPIKAFVVCPVPDPIILGSQAEDALKNPAIQIALDKIEAELINAWKSSAPKDAEAREHLYYRLEGLALFKAKLLGMVNNMRIEINKAKSTKAA